MIIKILNIQFILILFIYSPSCAQPAGPHDRYPAVSGQFYPSDSVKLYDLVDEMFVKAIGKRKDENVGAVISPHAGYVFSGLVAASAFNQVDPSADIENVFVIGSSHHVSFDGASVYVQGDYLTPLGRVKVNRAVGEELLKRSKIFSDRTDAHANEHSIEVQLPFLQRKLKKPFKIVPIVLGTQSVETSRKIAEILKPYFGSSNLFVISTDFSHYPSYGDANRIDKATAEIIKGNSADELIDKLTGSGDENVPNLVTRLCGWSSVLTLMFMTQNNPDISVDQIEYKNSGDAGPPGKDRVVGYHAFAYFFTKMDAGFRLNDNEKNILLKFARATIESYVAKRTPAEIGQDKLTDNLKINGGAFVTLRKNGELRGCIGRFDASEPLYKVVSDMAVASSTQDYRFPPVTPGEMKDITVEISVITPMRKIEKTGEIELGKHGIYIKKGNKSGTFLPQVAAETGWTTEEFLGHCSQDKAGIGWDGWRDAEIFIYEAYVFGEK